MKMAKESLTEKSLAAMRAAVRKVVEEHRVSRRPIAVWEGNRVVYKIPDSVPAVNEKRGSYNA